MQTDFYAEARRIAEQTHMGRIFLTRAGEDFLSQRWIDRRKFAITDSEGKAYTEAAFCKLYRESWE